MQTQIERYIGLDIHKAYFVAVGVNAAKQEVLRSQRVANSELEDWIVKVLRPTDAVVLEMTTNTWFFVDALTPFVSSVTVVHPPHVALITQAQVMNDKKASLILAKLHAAGLLPGVWVPPKEVRDLRALVAQRKKMSTLSGQAKCRLQAVLHRLRIAPPTGLDLYSKEAQTWWQALPVSAVERFRLGSDLDTLVFANEQIKSLEALLGALAAEDERVPLLVQLAGFGLTTAMTVLATVGDSARFASAEQLVGYAGLGARVHESGQTHWSGRITKAGRRDLRWTMVQAAHNAVKHHPHWKREYERLAQRIGRKKALVAIARKLLVAVWHVLNKECADRFADPTNVARSFFGLAYDIGVKNLPDGLTALKFTRQQLDRLGLGAELTQLPWGSKTFKLPPSRLGAATAERTSNGEPLA
jgi:transposase